MELITSTQNPKIKELIHLQKSAQRKEKNLVVVEGKREINEALRHGFALSSLFCCPELIKEKSLDFPEVNKIAITKSVFTKITYKENPDGYLAIFIGKHLTLDDIKLSSNPLVIILENVEKPGNLGAILRTAKATGVDAIIINQPQTDIYNPNVIRASMGHIFSQQVVVATIKETKTWLEKNKIISLAAATGGKKTIFEADLQKPCAIIMGTEAFGLSDDWLKLSDDRIKIPMKPEIDSLNVSVSTAVIIYEALRQRGKTKLR
ncbi:MAG: RNA methyltransferase [Planctomycetes bacterium]|nr:RNA methyltransferase [Planctomycetota bacterium]